MQVFSVFFKILKRQKHQFILYLGIFGIILGIMSNMGGEQRGDFETSKLDIVVFDRDQTPESRYLKEYMYSIHEKVTVTDDKEEIQDLLYYQVLDYVLYIEEGYAETGKLSNIKRPGSETGSYVDGQISSYVKAFRTYVAAGYSCEEANEKALASLEGEGLVNFLGKSQERSKIYYYYTYMTYIFIALLMNVLVPIHMVFKRKEITARNTVSPLKLKVMSGQLIGASGLLSITIWILFLLGGVCVFGNEFLSGNSRYHVINSFVFLLLAASMVCVVSCFRLSSQALSGVSNTLALGMAFLGGVFVPMEIFGAELMTVAKFVPTYWYVTACDSLYQEGAMDTFWQCIGVELLYAIAFVAIALVLSKIMRQRNA